MSDPYVYPGSGVLIKKFGIKNEHDGLIDAVKEVKKVMFQCMRYASPYNEMTHTTTRVALLVYRCLVT